MQESAHLAFGKLGGAVGKATKLVRAHGAHGALPHGLGKVLALCRAPARVDALLQLSCTNARLDRI